MTLVEPITKKYVYETKADTRGNSLVEENVLHRFASYNYVLTLSGLTRRQMDNPDQIPTDPAVNIIAKTGGIGPGINSVNPKGPNYPIRDTGDAMAAEGVQEPIAGSQRILNKGRDIYFNSVRIDSVPRPNEDRKLMNYTKIEMVLEEPNGITFWEKCRAAAFNGGYINHTTAPFLLTIEFKGFDSQGNEVPNPVPKRCYPIRLSKSSLTMNTGSTTYTVEAYPWTEFGMVNAFLYTRTAGTLVSKPTISEMVQQLSKQINEDIEDNEQKAGLRETKDVYQITVEPSIGLLQSQSKNVYPVTGFLNNFQRDNFALVRYSKNMSIVKIIEDLVRQFEKYNNVEKIIVDQAKRFSEGTKISEEEQYVEWFKIITTVKEEGEFDKILKTHARTIRYHVIPFKVHILNFIKAGLGLNFNYDLAVRKVFDYIYTGNNLDILNLNVEYNAGYYQAILRKADPSFFNRLKNLATKKIGSLFGTSTFQADGLLPLSAYITTLNTENPSVFPQESETNDLQGLADAQYDYLVNPKGDMVNVEMKIMGDPAFLGQDYAIPMRMGNTEVRANIGPNIWDPNLKAFNFDNGEVIVKLNFKFPSDFDENQGLYNFNTEATPQFSGLYRVIRVESNFENGQFTQNLTMARCNNQRRVTSTLNWAGANKDKTKSIEGDSEQYGLGESKEGPSVP